MRALPALGFALVALAYLDWGALALRGGLGLFAATLLAEALVLAALALLAWRGGGRRAALAAFCALPALEVAGLLALGEADIALLAYNAAIVVGLALVAWRLRARDLAAALRPGAPVVAAGFVVFLALALVSGDTFLLRGQVLGAAGWLALSAAPARGAQATSEATHAGARP